MRSLLPSLCFVAILSAGCNKEAAPPPVSPPPPAASTSAPVATAAPTASASAAPTDVAKKRRRPPYGGVIGLLFRATDDVNLDAAKKAKVEDLEKQLHDSAMPHAEMKALHEEITTEVKAGKIDEKKIDAKKADVEKAMKDMHGKHAELMNQLHALLDPAQRKTVVATARADLAKRDEHMAKRMAKMKEKAEADGKKPSFVGWLTKEVDLDAAQQKKVEAIAPKEPDWAADREAMKKHETAMLDAFEKDDFDGKKLQPPWDAMKHAHGAMDAKFLSKLVAILKPAQREKLADALGKMGPHHGPGVSGPGDKAGPGKAPGGPGGGMMGPPGMMGPGMMPPDDDEDEKH